MSAAPPSSKLVCVCCGEPTRQRCAVCKKPLHNQAQYTGSTICKNDHYAKYHHPPMREGNRAFEGGIDQWS